MRNISVIPGDGIGLEVTEQSVLTLDSLDLGLNFEVLEHINAGTFLREGSAMSDDDLARIRQNQITLFGAIGDHRVSSPEYGRSVLLRLRSELDLYVNHRPALLLDERLSPLRDREKGKIDCVVVRENTEGLYSGVGGAFRLGGPDAVGIDLDINSCKGVKRVLEYAFSIARRGVCMVDKANVVQHGGRIWTEAFEQVGLTHPAIQSEHLFADTAAMALVADPAQFDVIVTNNSYGDILSDIAAVISGGIGIAASANINPEQGHGLYEPVHGSAPDIAGKRIANPIGSILSAALLLDGIGCKAEAERVRKAVISVVRQGRCTADLGGSLNTGQVGAAIRASLS